MMQWGFQLRMGSCVVDMAHRQIKLLFACKRLILVENQDEIYL